MRGRITYDGKPVTTGVVNFFPDQAKPLGGPIRKDGTYEFALSAGTYQVAVNAPPPIPEGWKEGDPAPTLTPLVPPQFARPESSGLSLTVSGKESPQIHNIELP